MPPSPKSCVSCGRRITWRKKWEKSWDDVRYCSQACRRRGVTATDRALEDAITQSLGTSSTATVDPTEDSRRAARRLVATGEFVLVQGSKVVDPSTAKGPIAIRRVRP